MPDITKLKNSKRSRLFWFIAIYAVSVVTIIIVAGALKYGFFKLAQHQTIAKQQQSATIKP